MANFRQNHNKQGNRKSKNAGFFYTRLVIFTAVLIAFALGGAKMLSNFDLSEASFDNDVLIESDHATISDLATSTTGKIIRHKHYALSYNERHEIPEWVAYELTASSLKVKNVKRHKRFLVDTKISSKSASHGDYINSGYTRGHMAPAGDMAFDEQAMRESFYMSNIAPQIRVFNNGIWKELEESVRDWAYADKRLYIVTGPITKGIDTWVGKNEVGVPRYFYKAIVDLEAPKQKGIAFLIPHASSDLHLKTYAISIDELESESGVDFFGELLEDNLEEKLESTFNVNDWKFSKKRFKSRVQKWNHE